MRSNVLVTMLVVGVIYSAVLWANQNLISEERTTLEDYSSYAAGQPEESYERPTEVSEESRVKAPTIATTAEKRVNPEPRTPNSIDSFLITGITVGVDLSNSSEMQNQVISAWQRFSEHSRLHESVSWVANKNSVYAYYFEFNNDFTAAKLVIGYASKATGSGLTTVTVNGGQYKSFEFGAAGVSPDAAWDYAYPDGVILERYTVDISGNTTNEYVLVIK